MVLAAIKEYFRGPTGYVTITIEDDGLPIRVPLDIMVMHDAVGRLATDEQFLSEMAFIERAVAKATSFYAKQGIILQTRVKAIGNIESLLTFEDQNLTSLWYKTAHARLTGYVGMTRSSIGEEGKNFVGHTTSGLGYGAFIMAGAWPEQFVPDKSVKNLLDQIIIHEVGHYLLGNSNKDHKNNTFMDKTSSKSESVTDEQRVLLRKGALYWGGY